MDNWVEYVGYGASALVLVSFLMKKMRTLRLVNLAGCVLFILYGLLLPSYPIVVTNGAILLIHIYYLGWKSNKTSGS